MIIGLLVKVLNAGSLAPLVSAAAVAEAV